MYLNPCMTGFTSKRAEWPKQYSTLSDTSAEKFRPGQVYSLLITKEFAVLYLDLLLMTRTNDSVISCQTLSEVSEILDAAQHVTMVLTVRSRMARIQRAGASSHAWQATHDSL